MKKHSVSLAAITVAAVLLGLVSAAQAQVRVTPNFRLTNDSSPFRQKDQLGLAVNRTNPQHVVAVTANYLDLRCEASVSMDGGDTWSEAVPLQAPDPGVGAPFNVGCNHHQSVEFGGGNNVYVISTLARTMPSTADSGVIVFRSTNGGSTWERGQVVMQPGPGTNDPVSNPSPGPNYNRPSLAVDPGTGGAPDRVYAVARDFAGFGNSGPPGSPCTANCGVVKVAASTNGGQTFGAPVNASPVGVSAQDPPPSVVNADGSITVVWRTLGRVGQLQAARSTNQGQTWSAPINIAEVTNQGTLTTTHVYTGNIAQASSTATFPKLAADRNIPGRIYLVYTQGPVVPTGGMAGADHFINPSAEVWFQRSSNGGATWSIPKRISDPTPYPGSQTIQTRQPTVSVSPSGRVNVVWHDRRHWYQGPGERNCTHSHIFCEDIRLGDTYYSHSTDGGANFSPNIRINDRSHNNDVGADTRPAGYWAWGPISVTVGGGQILIGWMDSREGNWDTDTEDIYLAKVNFEASGPVPRTNIDEPDDVERSVRLSRLAYIGGNEGALVGGTRDPANAGVTGPAGGPSSRNASSVVIVNQGDVASAIAGTVLARANPGPVLLSPPGGLPASVRSEISRVRPARVFVIGNTTSLSAQVEADALAAAGPPATVTRISGGSDAATAADIAARLDPRTAAERTAGNPAFDAVVLVNPASPDAAAVTGLAAARRLPVLFVDANSVPAATQSALTSLNVNRALVVGGPSVVGSSVVTGLAAFNPTRLGGDDQYATSRAVTTEAAARGMPSNVVYVADGTRPMDGALLGGVVARATGQLVLAPPPLHQTVGEQGSQFGLTGINRLFVLGAPAPVAPPPPPPPPADDATPPPTDAVAPPAPTPPATAAPLASANLRVVRARLRGRRLELLVRVNTRASGRLTFSYRSGRRTTRFTRPIRAGRVSHTRLLTPAQARNLRRSRVLTVSYAGNSRVRRASTRARVGLVRAATRRAARR